jgi:hypothetical protein
MWGGSRGRHFSASRGAGFATAAECDGPGGSLWMHQEITQFYEFGCEGSNLGVSHRLRGHCEE